MKNEKINQNEDLKQIIEFVTKMIEKYPNDQELGKKIRNFYWEKLKK
jgi:hypothetical protein